MYTANGLWEDAMRVAKLFGGINGSKQVPYFAHGHPGSTATVVRENEPLTFVLHNALLQRHAKSEQ